MINTKLISNRIESRRIELGISQSQMAKMLDVKPASVARWETETNLLRPKNMVLICSILGLSVDDLLAVHIDETNLKFMNYKFSKFYKYLNNNYLNVGDSFIRDNIDEFIDFYIFVIDRLRELCVEKIKGNQNILDEFNYFWNGIQSFSKPSGMKVSDLNFESFEKKNVLYQITRTELIKIAVKIYRIDDSFDHLNLSYIYEDKCEMYNQDSVAITRYLIGNNTKIFYSDMKYLGKVDDYEPHQLIADNAYYVKDKNGYAAVVELINIDNYPYDPLVHDIYTFDRLYDYRTLDVEMLGFCMNKPKSLERYLLWLPDYRYNNLKTIYIEQCLCKDKLFSYGDIFMKIDYLKMKNKI